MRPSLPIVVTMNFNLPRTHLDSLRELILMSQKLDSEPSSQNNNAPRHSFIRICSKKDFSFRMNGMNSDGVPKNITQLWFSLFVSERAYEPY